jgi:hypothetical protein
VVEFTILILENGIPTTIGITSQLIRHIIRLKAAHTIVVDTEDVIQTLLVHCPKVLRANVKKDILGVVANEDLAIHQAQLETISPH